MNENRACKEIVWKIGPFVDGELPADERSEVESHLSACKDCVQMALDFRRLGTLVAKERVPVVSGEEWALLWERISERVKGADDERIHTIRRPFLQSRWLTAVVAAAACLLAGVGIGWLYFSPPKSGSELSIKSPGSQTNTDDFAQRLSGPKPTITVEDDVTIIDYSRLAGE